MSSIHLTILGSADAFNSGGRGHSCYWVEDRDGSLVVDFGPTALVQCKCFGLDPDRLGLVLFTHLHGDHVGGLPVLLIDLQYRAKRRRPLVVAGPPGTTARIAALMTGAYPDVWAKGLSFPLLVREWDVPGTWEMGGRRVQAIAALHDVEHHACSLRLTTGERVLAFSGDTGWQPGLAQLAAGADLFLCECTDAEPGYAAHISHTRLVEERAGLDVKRLVLTHLGEAMRAAAPRLRTEGWELAEDGDIYEV